MSKIIASVTVLLSTVEMVLFPIMYKLGTTNLPSSFTLKLLLIAHLIGDFFLQPVKLVEQKKNSIKWLIIHTIIYTYSVKEIP